MSLDGALQHAAVQDLAFSQRALGAVVGSAVGDALGAPFEFGPPRQYSRRFPEPVVGGTGEMIGGGGFEWAPGEFTDDTQMAIVQAESLLACGDVDGDDLFERFRIWASAASDVGIQTRSVLGLGAALGRGRRRALPAQPAGRRRQRFVDAGDPYRRALRRVVVGGDGCCRPADVGGHPRRPGRRVGHGDLPRS